MGMKYQLLIAVVGKYLYLLLDRSNRSWTDGTWYLVSVIRVVHHHHSSLRDFVLRRSFSPINIVNEKAYNTSKKVQRKTDAGLRGLPRPWWD